ncbi:coatomer protein complex, subunit beta 2 (beta prime) [Planoprotostelium fungivorum]|uniref:Coatomer subunit beta' n=1 Tax=Planoprotostelium fungivorum TaxID=1890364 RepID=A0A2P6NST7_9EUKA|nr:coatomer protein complex, subunit beta 2 (beta prime) [Planoprotostelium fungivorum]
MRQSLVKTFEVTDLPAKFISRKQWIVAGSDDMMIRVYNYNTMERIKAIEAHSDYIRCVVVHPTQPYVLSCSDDMFIKLWDWEKGWTCTQVFEGHAHYVMMLVINPKDTNTFASASLDHTIKVWAFNSTTPNFTLEGHEKGVNSVEYYIGGDKPYLISGADDKLVKIWDYQNKACVQTLDGHTQNVSVATFHPELPIIITGSEDGTVKIWHSNTYRLEKTLNYGMERVWSISHTRGSNAVAIGYDEGTVMIKLGKERPIASMDANGKIIWARHNEIQTVNVKSASEGEVADGERLQLATKELGNCEVFPQSLQHTPNGRFVVVCGDGEYIIYTALAWRNKSFGSAAEFVWSNEANGEYAVRETSSKVKVFKNFKEVGTVKTNFSPEGIFGGALLAIRSKDSVSLYDWQELRIVRRIDVTPKQIYWADNGEHLCIACDSAFYILKFNKGAVEQFFASGEEADDDGFEEAFEILHEVNEKVRTGLWVGDCFIFTTANNRLNYFVGGETVTISHLDRKLYLLGYIPRDNRLYLIDKQYNVVSYTLHLNIINYQTAVLRGDMETASQILPNIPNDHRNRIAQFLDAQGFKEQALEVSLDPDHQFELSVQLNQLERAYNIAKENDSEQKWRQLGDLSFSIAKFDLAEECLFRGGDLNGLLLLYTSTGNVGGIEKLAQQARESGKNNITFASLFLLRKIDACIELLCSTGRIPEACFLARTYMPSQVPRLVKLWKEDLQTVNPRAAESLADPVEYSNLFPDFELALEAEKKFSKRLSHLPASKYSGVADDLSRDLLEELRSGNVKPDVTGGVEYVEKSQQAPVAVAQPARVEQSTPVKETPVKETPVKETPVKEMPMKGTQVAAQPSPLSPLETKSAPKPAEVKTADLLDLSDDEDALTREIEAQMIEEGITSPDPFGDDDELSF